MPRGLALGLLMLKAVCPKFLTIEAKSQGFDQGDLQVLSSCLMILYSFLILRLASLRRRGEWSKFSLYSRYTLCMKGVGSRATGTYKLGRECNRGKTNQEGELGVEE